MPTHHPHLHYNISIRNRIDSSEQNSIGQNSEEIDKKSDENNYVDIDELLKDSESPTPPRTPNYIFGSHMGVGKTHRGETDEAVENRLMQVREKLKTQYDRPN